MTSIDPSMHFSSAAPLAHVDELRKLIQKQPQRSDLRVFLFQLYCVQGAWTRAATQLDVLLELDPSTKPMVQTYREALKCELLRRDVFDGKRSPLVLGAPPDWLAWLLEALRMEASPAGEGREDALAAAAELRGRALEAAPATPGSLNGARFEWMADADARLGPVLEAIVNGKYYWIPLSRVMRIEIEAPADLRDFVWTPVTLTLATGAAQVALVPTRYPGTEHEAADALRLARATEWREFGQGAWHGVGQRMWATDTAEFALLDAREIVLDVPVEPAAAEPPGPESP